MTKKNGWTIEVAHPSNKQTRLKSLECINKLNTYKLVRVFNIRVLSKKC